ncbi:MAG: hypothetical protein ACRDYD_12605 [Acidimicrobiales bacterium]
MGAGRARELAVIRAGWGVLLLAAPGAVLRAGGMGAHASPWRSVVRVLGARHLAQALTEPGAGRTSLRLGAAVDALHLLSDLALALADRRRRRPALSDAAVTAALGFAGLTLSTLLPAAPRGAQPAGRFPGGSASGS